MGLNIDKFKGLPIIKHINLRKEGPDDAEVVAVDLKFSAKLQGASAMQLLNMALGSEKDEAHIFWDVEGNLDFLGVSYIKSEMVFNGGEKAELLGYEFPEVKVHKFKFIPRDELAIDFEFSISIKDVANNRIGVIGEHLGEGVNLKISCAQKNLFEKSDKVNE